MPLPKIKYEFTPADKLEITPALQQIALDIAHYWDVLREIEGRDNVEITNTDELFKSLAGDCTIPPSLSDLPMDTVWQSFVDDVTVRGS